MPPEKHWSLDEWIGVVFRAMAVSGEELQRIALSRADVQILMKAVNNGQSVRYTRDNGTDVTFSVYNRPLILDRGRIGDNILAGPIIKMPPLTNQPTTEVFIAPIEDSMNGTLVYTVPLRRELGIIRPTYKIHVKDGKVYLVEADEVSKRLIDYYTGQKQISDRAFTPDEAEAFALQRTIAEFAIGGFNPAFFPYLENGRLLPVVGEGLIDEKLGPHQAFGANTLIAGSLGKTPSSYKGVHVDHTDFVMKPGGKLELLN